MNSHFSKANMPKKSTLRKCARGRPPREAERKRVSEPRPAADRHHSSCPRQPALYTPRQRSRGSMAVLFVSHASRDDAMARSLAAWLRAKGFTDLFVDHSDIDAGEKWAQALRDAAGACRVVVCLVTENWLASDECFGEFKAAWYMGKRIIPLFALPLGGTGRPERLGKVQAEDQGLELASCRTA